ncbi:MAG: hypothetical protein R2880_18850 [Deinococcales bacterium]
MLMNNLDPANAEIPQELIVYGVPWQSCSKLAGRDYSKIIEVLDRLKMMKPCWCKSGYVPSGGLSHLSRIA